MSNAVKQLEIMFDELPGELDTRAPTNEDGSYNRALAAKSKAVALVQMGWRLEKQNMSPIGELKNIRRRGEQAREFYKAAGKMREGAVLGKLYRNRMDAGQLTMAEAGWRERLNSKQALSMVRFAHVPAVGKNPGNDNIVKTWAVEDNVNDIYEFCRIVPRHTMLREKDTDGDQITCLTYSHDGKMLFVGNKKSESTLWDPASGRWLSNLIPTNQTKEFATWMGRFSADSQRLVTAGEGDAKAPNVQPSVVYLWDVMDPRRPNMIARAPGLAVLNPIFFSNSEAIFFAATMGNKAIILDFFGMHALNKPKTLEVVHGEANDKIKCIAFSADGKYLASSVKDKIKVHQCTNKQFATMEKETANHDAEVTVMKFMYDMNAAGVDGQQLRDSAQHADFGAYLVSGSKGRLMITDVSKSGDKAGQLWDSKKDGNHEKHKIHEKYECGEVNAICFSRDGQKMAVGCEDGKVRVFKTKMKNKKLDVEFWELLENHGDSPIKQVEFCPDHLTLLSISDDRKVSVWFVSEHKKARDTEDAEGAEEENATVKHLLAQIVPDKARESPKFQTGMAVFPLMTTSKEGCINAVRGKLNTAKEQEKMTSAQREQKAKEQSVADSKKREDWEQQVEETRAKAVQAETEKRIIEEEIVPELAIIKERRLYMEAQLQEQEEQAELVMEKIKKELGKEKAEQVIEEEISDDDSEDEDQNRCCGSGDTSGDAKNGNFLSRMCSC